MISTITTHTNAIDANIVRGKLEAEGIPALVQYEHHVWMMWSISLALGGVRVVVPPSCADAAQQIIMHMDNGYYADELQEEVEFTPPLTCPRYGSGDIAEDGWSWKIALVCVFMISLPIPYTRHMMRCQECTNIWINSEQKSYPIHILFLYVLSFMCLAVIAYFLLSCMCVDCVFYGRDLCTL